MTHNAADTARSMLVTNETRGHEIKARRLALGIKSVREFAEASGIDRGALSKAESGQASSSTYDRAEAWLSGMEEETGHDEPAAPAGLIRFKVEGVYGAKALVVEGPVENLAELEEMVDRVMRRLANQGDAGE